jgi:hypothetical protein
MAGSQTDRGVAGPALHWLFLVAAVCALGLALVPRALAPIELPALTLSAADVRAVRAQDARRAAAAPSDGAAAELMTTYLEFGRSEVSALEDPQLMQQRRRLLHRLYQRVLAERGEEAALGLRESALAKFEDALESRLPRDQIKSVLGIFPTVLAQHRATQDGLEVAPHFVIRSLYKARWNRMVGLDLDYGFAPVEQIAYYGWLGLHADNLSLDLRRRMLFKYAAAGGAHAAEAQGVLAFLDQDYVHALQALTQAYAELPSLRLRNYVQGAMVAARSSARDDAPGSRLASRDGSAPPHRVAE